METGLTVIGTKYVFRRNRGNENWNYISSHGQKARLTKNLETFFPESMDGD